MEMLVTTDDGVRLRVMVEGPLHGAPLLLSNSLGSDLSVWEAQATEWSRTHRVVRYDIRGHGGSDVVDGGYSIERLGRDALAVADAVGWQRFTCIGLSLGAMTGLWLAIHERDRLTRLVAAGGAAFAGGAAVWNDRIEAVRARGIAAVADGVMSRWFTPQFASERPATVEHIRRVLLATSPLGYVGCSAAIRDLDLRPLLDRIVTPLLLIGGTHDAGPSPAALSSMAAVIPGARLELLDAAHLSNVAQPTAFNRLVETFLS